MQERTDTADIAAAIAQTLLDQRAHRVERGLYWETQIAFAYNSEKLEGNPLSREQTRSIFETRTLDASSVPLDSVTEMRNHFRMFDLMLDTLGEPLSPQLMQRFHAALKAGTADDLDNPDFVVGGWKAIPNSVGNLQQTTPPAQVQGEIERLLGSYGRREEKTYRDIAGLHVFFERIHPFQDGNGRVGRLIMFRECLAGGLVPFVVLDEQRPRYYRGLQEFSDNPELLIGFFEEMAELYLREFGGMIPDKLLLPRYREFLRRDSTVGQEAAEFFGA